MSGFALSVDGLQSLCQRRGLEFKVNEDRRQIAVLHRVLGEDAPLYVTPHAGRSMVSFALPLPFRVPAGRLGFVGEAVMRLNAAAAMGAWVLDHASGEVAFRTTLPAFGAEYTDDGVLFVIRVVTSAVAAAAADLRTIALADRTSFDLWPRADLVPGA